MSDELHDLLTIAPAGPEGAEPEFPIAGDTFDLWVAVIPDCDDPPQILDQFTDPKLSSAMCELGGSPQELDDFYFNPGDVAKLDLPGLWKISVVVSYSSDYDWETGHRESNLELTITKAERVGA